MCKLSAISDLSCYIIIIYKMGQEQEGVGQESLTTAVLASSLFSYTLPLFDLIKSQRRFHILELEAPKEQNWGSKSRVQ